LESLENWQEQSPFGVPCFFLCKKSRMEPQKAATQQFPAGRKLAKNSLNRCLAS
jgi:hypothetical protein